MAPPTIDAAGPPAIPIAAPAAAPAPAPSHRGARRSACNTARSRAQLVGSWFLDGFALPLGLTRFLLGDVVVALAWFHTDLPLESRRKGATPAPASARLVR